MTLVFDCFITNELFYHLSLGNNVQEASLCSPKMTKTRLKNAREVNRRKGTKMEQWSGIHVDRGYKKNSSNHSKPRFKQA